MTTVFASSPSSSTWLKLGCEAANRVLRLGVSLSGISDDLAWLSPCLLQLRLTLPGFDPHGSPRIRIGGIPKFLRGWQRDGEFWRGQDRMVVKENAVQAFEHFSWLLSTARPYLAVIRLTPDTMHCPSLPLSCNPSLPALLIRTFWRDTSVLHTGAFSQYADLPVKRRKNVPCVLQLEQVPVRSAEHETHVIQHEAFQYRDINLRRGFPWELYTWSACFGLG